jgi:glycosyltransferase involved in cell wall biosynthesis
MNAINKITPRMDLSFVVATRNRGEFLPAMLESLRGLKSSLRWEVIFVDNGSTDATAEVLEAFRRSFEMPVRVLSEPRPGAGRARNTGWRAAMGRIIAFIDDDCYPAPDYIDQVESCFAASGIGYIGGRVLLHDVADLRITIQESTERLLLPPRRFIYAGVLQGANWAARRCALEQVGGFDPNLGPGTKFVCEEVELQARLSAVGWTGAFEPGPLVYHHHRRKSLSDISTLQRSYDLGRGAYYAKCILDPRMRTRYAKEWLYTMRFGPTSRVVREIRSAANYFWMRASGKLEVTR